MICVSRVGDEVQMSSVGREEVTNLLKLGLLEILCF
jgi:hypothetical protein